MAFNKEKFLKLVVERSPSTMQHLKEMRASRPWRRKAQLIALAVWSYMTSNQLTQQEMEKRLEMTTEEFYRLLTGKYDIPISHICKVENLLGITIIDFDIDKLLEKKKSGWETNQ